MTDDENTIKKLFVERGLPAAWDSDGDPAILVIDLIKPLPKRVPRWRQISVLADSGGQDTSSRPKRACPLFSLPWNMTQP